MRTINFYMVNSSKELFAGLNIIKISNKELFKLCLLYINGNVLDIKPFLINNNGEEIDSNKFLLIQNKYQLFFDEKKIVGEVTKRLVKSKKAFESQIENIKNAINEILKIGSLEQGVNFASEKDVSTEDVIKISHLTIFNNEQDYFNRLVSYISLYYKIFFIDTVIIDNLLQILSDEEIRKFNDEMSCLGIYCVDFEEICEINFNSANKLHIDDDLIAI